MRNGAIVGSEIRRPPVRIDTALLTVVTDDGNETNLIEKWASYHRTCRVTAYVLRFCHLTYAKLAVRRAPKSHWLFRYNKNEWRSESFVTITIRNEQYCIRQPSLCEIRIAFHYWVKLSQRTSFPEDLKAVSNKQLVDKKSALYNLTPQLDDNQLLQICGRLGNSNLPYEVKHPIILSRTSTLARLVAQEAHRILCHGAMHSISTKQVLDHWSPHTPAQSCTAMRHVYAIQTTDRATVYGGRAGAPTGYRTSV